MNCTTCEQGERQPGLATMTIDRDGQLSVLRHVPAAICDACGAWEHNGETAAAAYEQMRALRATGQPIAIAEFIVAPTSTPV